MGPIEEMRPLDLANPLLARELRKLPEILGGISPEERQGLAQMTTLYLENGTAFDAAFDQMAGGAARASQVLFSIAGPVLAGRGRWPVRPGGSDFRLYP